MWLTEAGLKKINKDEVIPQTLEYQAKFNSTVASIADLKSNFRRLESELSISRPINSKLCGRVTSLERQCWANNQYSRRECLEITVLPEDTENGNLEDLTLKFLNKIGVNIGSKNVEDYHWIKTQGPKKIIIKFSKRKDGNKVRTEKKKVKGKNLTSLGINKPTYINNSLCTYYKKLWAKCKNLHDNQVIHAFWISNGLIKLKVLETGNVHTVTHDIDLEVLFPGNSLIEDVRRMWVFFLFKLSLCFLIR